MNLIIKFSTWAGDFFLENDKNCFLTGKEIRKNKDYDYALTDKSGNIISVLQYRRKWFGYSKEYDGVFLPEDTEEQIPFYLYHKPHWKPFTKAIYQQDEYLVVQHKFWYLSIFKNDYQIGLIKEQVFYLGSRNSFKVWLNADADLNLICTILFGLFINKADDGEMFNIDLSSIGPELRKRDESWQPNLKA